MGRKSNIEKLKEFKEKVSKDLKVDRMILFGSRAKGKYGLDTDFDLIVVSKEFRKLDMIERGAKMYDYWNLRRAVDFICYTDKEFEKLSKRESIVTTALREGVEI